MQILIQKAGPEILQASRCCRCCRSVDYTFDRRASAAAGAEMGEEWRL